MIHAIYIYLIIGAWFAGLNVDAGIMRSPLMLFGWPVAIVLIWRENNRQKKRMGL